MTRPLKPLTPEQRELAAEAWILVQPFLRRYCRDRQNLQLDFESAVAERICRLISTFDRRIASLRTWALMQARYACQDLLKNEGPINRRGKARPHRVGDVVDYPGAPLALVELDEVDLADHEVLRGVEARTRQLMADCYGYEVLQADAGLRFGLSPTGVSRLLRVGLAKVRERLGLDSSGRRHKHRKGA